MNKKLITIACSFLLCLLLNLYKHNGIFVGLINSLILSLSILLFVDFKDKKITLAKCFLIVTLAIIPLFQYNPENIVFNLDKDHTIFSMPEVQNGINKHQQDALYIPFRLRPVFYNNLIYINFALSRVADFISLKTIYDVLLLTNLYPLFLGLFLGIKKSGRNKFVAYLAILLALIYTGINKSPDKFGSFFIISPVILYFILLGMKKINTKFYLFLLAVSLIIITGPPL